MSEYKQNAEHEEEADEISPEQREKNRILALISSSIFTSLGINRDKENDDSHIRAYLMSIDVMKRVSEEGLDVPADLLEKILIINQKLCEGRGKVFAVNTDFIGVIIKIMQESGNFGNINIIGVGEVPYLEMQIRKAALDNNMILGQEISKEIGSVFIGSSHDEIISAFKNLISVREICRERINQNVSLDDSSLLNPERLSPEYKSVVEAFEEIGFSSEWLKDEPWTVIDMIKFMGLDSNWLDMTKEEQTSLLQIMNAIAKRFDASLEITQRGPVIIAKE